MASWAEIREQAESLRIWALRGRTDIADAEFILTRVDELHDHHRGVRPAASPVLNGADAVLEPETKFIWVSDAVPERWRAFYEAHEHAHISLGTSCTGAHHGAGPSAGEALVGYSPAERREREADVFAAALLVPTDLLLWWFVEQGLSASAIAERAEVPVELVLNQLGSAVLTLGMAAEAPAAPAVERALVASQEDAAQAMGRPTLVSAGPGTGKTRTLVGRIAYLLELGVAASSILVITYGTKAAAELRERIQRFNADAAQEMWIGTFHSFGLELLRKYGSAIGLGPKPQVLDRTEAEDLLEELLPQLALAHYEDLRDPGSAFRALLDGISRAKDELATPADYQRLAEAMHDGAAEGSPELLAAKRALEVARVYRVSQQRLDQEGRLDFGDMIRKARQVLLTDEAARRQVRAQYRHLLVDEYQDTNRASGTLLKELAGDGRGLWVVGDSRQAIYRWRGASPENVARFAQDFPGAEVVTLRRNYRSQPRIIDVFTKWATGMAVSDGKAFEGWEPNRTDGGGDVQMYVAEDEDSEAAGVAARVRELEAKGVPLREQAVLCQTHAHLRQMAARLGGLGVPVLYMGSVLDRPEARALLCVLSLAAGESSALRWVADLDEYRIPPADAEAVRALACLHPKSALGEVVARALSTARLSPEGREGLQRLARHLDGVSFGTTPYDFLRQYLFERSDFGRRLAADASVEGVQARMAVGALLELARASQAKRRPRKDPKRAFLESLRQADDEQTLKQIPDWAEGIEAVRLMTVHGAKGLEFRSVYLPRMRARHFPRDRKRDRVPLPKGLGPEGDYHDAEEECLMFVALSRAGEFLWMSYAASRDERTSNASRFYARLSEALGIEPTALPKWAPPRAPAAKSEAVSQPASEGSPVFDFRAVDVYLTCPRRYLHEEQLRLPRHRSDSPYAQLHGSVYETMAWVKDQWAEGKPVDLGAALTALRSIWETKGPRDHALEERYRQRAEEYVARFLEWDFGREAAKAKPTWSVQLPNGTITVDRGYLEHSEEGGTKRVVVRNVKTGKPSREEANDPLYGLLARGVAQANPGAEVRVEFAHLAADVVTEVEISPEAEQGMLARLDDAVRGIRAGVFPAEPKDDK